MAIKNLISCGLPFAMACITTCLATEENFEKGLSPVQYVHPIEGTTT